MSDYLRTVSLDAIPNAVDQPHPLNVPAFAHDFRIEISSPVLFLYGENGVGKSSLLSAVAAKSGFNSDGGSHNHHFGEQRQDALADRLTLAWRTKIRRGFFLKADQLAKLNAYLDDLSRDDPTIFDGYGGERLSEKSHGERLFALCNHQFRNGLFLLDEPDTALSVSKQLALVSLIKARARDEAAQFVIATHSPLLLSIPGAQIIELSEAGLRPCLYEDTDAYQTSKLFFDAPERFHRHL